MGLRDDEEPVALGRAEVIKAAASGKANLYQLDEHAGEEVWLPHSHVVTSPTPKEGDMVENLEVTPWIAGEKGLEGPTGAATSQERQSGAQRSAERAVTPVRENTEAIERLEGRLRELHGFVERTTRAMGKFCRVLSSIIAKLPKAERDAMLVDLREVPKIMKAPTAPPSEDAGDGPGEETQGGPDTDPEIGF